MNKVTHTHTIYAPVSGKTIALSSVPDLYSQNVSQATVSPFSQTAMRFSLPATAVSPCSLTPGMPFALTTPDGVQILVHLGLDTVIMNGEGITALHHPGEEVTAGTPILRLDLPLLRKKKINFVSPVLIVNYDKVQNMKIQAAGKHVQAGTDVVLQFDL